MKQALSSALGITPEQLDQRVKGGERLQDLAKEAIQTMSPDVSAEQAALEAETLLKGPAGAGGPSEVSLAVMDTLASALGLAAEDLQVALRNGYSPKDIAEANGLSVQDVTATLKESLAGVIPEEYLAQELAALLQGPTAPASTANTVSAASFQNSAIRV